MAGLVHIYCGDGKGKTTAAVGLAVRAAGRGKKVLIARFLKTDDSGEVKALSHIPGITLISCEQSFGFSWNMTPQIRKEAVGYYGSLFSRAWEQAADFDMLILDEIMAACSQGFVEEKELISRLKSRPDSLEVVLTGRSPSEEILAQGDYVTEMKCLCHPYERGIGAREGIEW